MKKNHKNLGYVFLLFLFIGVYAWNRNPDVRVVRRVINGDTIELAGGERVRYIGIDTRKFDHSSREIEHYAWEAHEANRRMVEGKKVELEFDVQERDRYGLLLAYVYVDGLMMNEWLVANGYARVASFPPNVKYVERFRELEQEARRLEIGMWGQIE